MTKARTGYGEKPDEKGKGYKRSAGKGDGVVPWDTGCDEVVTPIAAASVMRCHQYAENASSLRTALSHFIALIGGQAGAFRGHPYWRLV